MMDFWVKCMFERLKVTSSIVGNFPRLMNGHVFFVQKTAGFTLQLFRHLRVLAKFKEKFEWFCFLFSVAVWNVLDMVFTYKWLFLHLSQVFIFSMSRLSVFRLILRNKQGPLLFFAWATCWLSFNQNMLNTSSSHSPIQFLCPAPKDEKLRNMQMIWSWGIQPSSC